MEEPSERPDRMPGSPWAEVGCPAQTGAGSTPGLQLGLGRWRGWGQGDRLGSEPEQSVYPCSEVSLTPAWDCLCPPPRVSHLRRLQGYCSALGVLRDCAAAPASCLGPCWGRGQWVGRGLLPRAPSELPPCWCSRLKKPGLCRKAVLGVSQSGKPRMQRTSFSWCLLPPRGLPLSSFLCWKGQKAAASSSLPFTPHSSFQTFPLSPVDQLCPGRSSTLDSAFLNPEVLLDLACPCCTF